VSRNWGRAFWSFGYELLRTDFLARATTEHHAEASADVPLGDRSRLYLQLRAGFGSTLSSQELRVQLSRRF
jgi:hypothetical protein